MATLPKKVLDQALKLPPEQRAALAGSLIESLEDREIEEGAEASWTAEISRRIKDLEGGKSHPVPWAEARRRILAEPDDQGAG